MRMMRLTVCAGYWCGSLLPNNVPTAELLTAFCNMTYSFQKAVLVLGVFEVQERTYRILLLIE